VEIYSFLERDLFKLTKEGKIMGQSKKRTINTKWLIPTILIIAVSITVSIIVASI